MASIGSNGDAGSSVPLNKPSRNLVPILHIFTFLISRTTKVLRPLVRITVRTTVEVATLGPLGPGMTRAAVHTVRSGNRLVRFGLSLTNSNKSLREALWSGIAEEIKGIGIGRKLLLMFIIAQIVNTRRRLRERVLRAASVQAYRRLNQEGLFFVDVCGLPLLDTF